MAIVDRTKKVINIVLVVVTVGRMLNMMLHKQSRQAVLADSEPRAKV
jgi:hypothetical protein